MIETIYVGLDSTSRRFKNQLKDVPMASCLGTFQTGQEALWFLKKKRERVNLLFFEFEILRNQPPLLIDELKSFCAAIITVFEENVSDEIRRMFKTIPDYLFSPVNVDSLMNLFDRIPRQANTLRPLETAEIPYLDLWPDKPGGRTSIKKRINIDRIVYISVQGNHALFHVLNEPSPLVLVISLLKLQRLYPEYFIRISRFCLVNESHIKALGKNHVKVSTDLWLEKGKRYKSGI